MDHVGVVQVVEQEGIGVVHVGAVLIGRADEGKESSGRAALVQRPPPDAVDAPGDNRAPGPGHHRVLAPAALTELDTAHPAHGAQSDGHGVEREPRKLRVTLSQLRHGPRNKT